MRARLVVVALLATGCSALINPDVDRLGDDVDAGPGEGFDAGRSDAGERPDAGPGDDAGPRPDGGPGDDAGPACPPSCDDGVACTVDECEMGGCVNTPDDDACPGDERCSASLGCVPSRCSTDAECDDGSICNGVERCDPSAPGSGCVSGAPMVCDDGASCTSDSCSDGAGGCVFAPDDSACGDGVDCTVDACRPADSDEPSGCVTTPDDSLCASDFCTVGARCTNRGCAGGSMRDCLDGDPCTADSCDAAAMMCVSVPRDDDGDGYPAEEVVGGGGTVVSCAMGTDCDDGEGSINPGATEACNLVDDDCDGDVDEGCPDTFPDDCSTAGEIALGGGSMSGSARGSFAPLDDDYRTNPVCMARMGGRDAVYYVDLPRGTWDVEIDTLGSTADTVLGVGFDCSTSGLQAVCNDDYDSPSVGTQSRVWLHRVGSAATSTRFYILVDAFRDTTMGDYTVNVRASRARDDSCGSAIGTPPLDITDGGSVLGFIGSFSGSQSGSCASGSPFNQPEAIFQIDGPPSGVMDIDVYSTEFTPDIWVDRGCGGSEVACDAGSGLGGGVNGAFLEPSVTAGTSYYLVVDGGRGAYAVYYDPS